jgi:glycosyltransferase involved in cell wall biosynthesis
VKQIILVTNGKLDINNYASGQEYFLYKLKDVLEKEGCKAEFIPFKNFKLKIQRKNVKPEIVHVFYLNSLQLVNLKILLTHSSIIYHVYHVKDDTWSNLQAFSWKVFLFYSQFIVSTFMATSLSVNRWLNQKIIASKIALVEPFYECTCGCLKNRILFYEKFNQVDSIRLLYIGRLHNLRFSVGTILKVLARCQKKKIELIIATLSESLEDFNENQKNLQGTNIKLKILNRRLNEEEKCALYRLAHFFLYPAVGNVAMNPPITLLEATYHGALPVAFSNIVKDLDIPEELTINNIQDLLPLIEKLSEDPDLAFSIYSQLLTSMERFFNKQRFLGELTRYHLA